jgi:hypothetical protein
MSKNTWFITRASSGLGHALARHVLKPGDTGQWQEIAKLRPARLPEWARRVMTPQLVGELTSSNRPIQSCQLRTNTREPIGPRNGLSRRKELLNA